ncbi:signal transduction histidine kinase [Methylobacterium sp. 4-46]|uniref:PAS domain S-box protein n=1 Tax=unclassified Methylobacterium TaxID=2615210 RepID=UPI000152C7DF|nr:MULTISPECIES: sensor histidine kinase [Methylobacterium]ACA15381.1 signal transduction histidine kinase [Methylobacterium sp. 4-46]WFT81102.1 PAS domain S-box protein [Methylobacterium nodulans]
MGQETASATLGERLAQIEAEMSLLRERVDTLGEGGHPALVELLLQDNARRREAEDELRVAQAWMQLAQETGGVAAYQFDLERGVLTWSPSTYALYGWTPSQRQPSLDTWLASIHPDDRAAARAVAERAIREGEPVSHAFRIVRPGGDTRWIADRARVLTDAQGRPERIVGLNIDVTELRRVEAALRESEAQFRLTFENVAVGVALVGLDGRFLRVNPCLCAFLGYSAEDLACLTVQELTHPPDLAADLAQLRRLRDGEIDRSTLEKRFVTRAGRLVWAELSVTLRRDAAGRPAGYVSVMSDIERRKRAEEQLTFALSELSHRAKNLFTVVQSLIRQTGASAPSVAAFQDALTERLSGLAASQSLLVEHEGSGTPLGLLVSRQLASFVAMPDPRIRIEGPELPLNRSATQTLGLVLHELATNACKYGALSTEKGRLAVTWRIAGHPAPGARLDLAWQEAEGPPVRPPVRKGFGHRVIDAMARQSLEAEVDLRFAPEGLSWRLVAPVAHLRWGP